jgi:hypothetical protein
MPGLKRASAALLLLAGCARMGLPPGGPPDFRAPTLLSTYPESTTVLPNFDGWVEFQFDETVSEGAQPNFGLGSGDLERLVLLSPSKPREVPRVAWHRSRISVRPRDGWRPNTVYRVELAPGLRDLSRGGKNEVRVSHVITFSTGGELPTRAIEGRAVDWATRRFVPGALVEAMLLPDSLVYRSVADSNGRFTLGPLPSGELLVGVTADQNRNASREMKEAWDSVRVPARASHVGEVWVFQRDTMPPKVTDAVRTDSANITLTFAQPIDPLLTIPADSIRVLWLVPDSAKGTTDSSSIGPMSAMPKAAHDSAYRAIDAAARAAIEAAKADSARANARPDSARADSAAADTTARAKPAAGAVKPRGDQKAAADSLPADEPLEKRPPLGSQLVIRTRGFTVAGRSYWIEVHGVRSAGGSTGSVTRKLVLAKPAPPPKSTTAADSLKARPDSVKARSDTTTVKPATRP